jgi:hypothetical protein
LEVIFELLSKIQDEYSIKSDLINKLNYISIKKENYEKQIYAIKSELQNKEKQLEKLMNIETIGNLHNKIENNNQLAVLSIINDVKKENRILFNQIEEYKSQIQNLSTGCKILYEKHKICLEENEKLPENSYFGNILTDIDLYYNDEFGNKEYIEWDTLTDIENAINEHTDVYFDITYHIGAVINKITNDSSNSVKYELNGESLNGVKYIDTFKVTDERANYYMADGNSFIVKYFKLSPNIDNNGIYEYQKTKFEIAIVGNKIITVSNISSNVSCKGGRVQFNLADGKNIRDYIAAPVFRQEFNLGSSYYQNIEADIYIDRGAVSAIDRHLKLQEIRTLESMENYANGSTFNLIEQ